MKTRPILFSGAMVRAILGGQKSQTRRIIRDAPDEAGKLRLDGRGILQSFIGDLIDLPEECEEAWHMVVGEHGCETPVRCPYGQPGDRLWVRECVYYDLGDKFPKTKPDDLDPLYYRADGECCEQIAECCCAEVGKPRWTPSIHMPRWASRLTLEITDMRVQRLDEISEDDALADGISYERVITGTEQVPGGYREVHGDRFFFDGGDDEGYLSAVDAYAELWETINGIGSWAANPWVWALTFKRVEQA